MEPKGIGAVPRSTIVSSIALLIVATSETRALSRAEDAYPLMETNQSVPSIASMVITIISSTRVKPKSCFCLGVLSIFIKLSLFIKYDLNDESYGRLHLSGVNISFDSCVTIAAILLAVLTAMTMNESTLALNRLSENIYRNILRKRKSIS